jgi:hypothetical protein
LAPAEKLIAAYEGVIDRAHAKSIKVIGTTLLPIQNSRKDTPANEATRQAVNRWIRDARQFARQLRWKYLSDTFFKIGADGNFTLYEDEGDSYGYEKGAYATIPIQWKESSEILTIGKRTGEFARMRNERTFHIVWVSANHGVGIASTGQPDVVVQYKGDAVKISRSRKSQR